MYAKRLAMESRARYMWSLDDEDLELRAEGHEFQIDRFFERFACGFPEGPPLIAQPLSLVPARRRSMCFNYHEFLRRVGKAQMPFITEVVYVEYQAPLVDARFWLFLMDVIGDTIAALEPLEDSYRTDWGMDAVWCGAARHYAASRLAGQAMSRRARAPWFQFRCATIRATPSPTVHSLSTVATRYETGCRTTWCPFCEHVASTSITRGRTTGGYSESTRCEAARLQGKNCTIDS